MDKYQQLEKLKELLDAGILSQEEFDAEKKVILAEDDHVSEPVAEPKQQAPVKKPSFFSEEAYQQRYDKFNKLSDKEKAERYGYLGAIVVVFIFILFVIIPMVMLFGWDILDFGMRNLIGK